MCTAPTLTEVLLASSYSNPYTFNLFFASSSNCTDVIYEYSCDGEYWESCVYDECGRGFGCNSPVQVIINENDCATCNEEWFFRLTQCCPNNLQSVKSNIISYTPEPVPSTSPSVTPTRTPTPSITPTISISNTPTPTPSITRTPSISVTPGLCRYVTSLNALTITGNYVKVQYVNCQKEVKIFTVYLPTGSSITDISSLGICMSVGTSLIVLNGFAESISPILGGYCG